MPGRVLVPLYQEKTGMTPGSQVSVRLSKYEDTGELLTDLNIDWCSRGVILSEGELRDLAGVFLRVANQMNAFALEQKREKP